MDEPKFQIPQAGANIRIKRIKVMKEPSHNTLDSFTPIFERSASSKMQILQKK